MIRTIRVDCVTLQNVLDVNEIKFVDLLKVDIEGAEYEAVMGSPEVFKSGRVKAIVLEYHSDILSKRGLQASAIHDFLLASGYMLDAKFSRSVYVRS